MANEGDFREDNADRSAASELRCRRATGSLARLQSGLLRRATSSPPVRDPFRFARPTVTGLRQRQHPGPGGSCARPIYDDGRSRDKGVEPEGVALLKIGGRTFAFVGLERVTTSARLAIFDITDPTDTHLRGHDRDSWRPLTGGPRRVTITGATTTSPSPTKSRPRKQAQPRAIRRSTCSKGSASMMKRTTSRDGSLTPRT